MRYKLHAGLCALVLALTACTAEQPAAPASSPGVSPEQGGQATVAGVSVRVPPGAVDEPSRLSVTSSMVMSAPIGATPASSLISVDMGNGELQQPATVTFPKPPGNDPLVVLWEDGSGGWEPLPTRVIGAQVIARTEHFSSGFLARIDIAQWGRDRAEDLKNYLTGRSGVAQPACGDEAAARQGGVTVTSDSGDSIKWCFGLENGRTVLKVANNRRTFTTVTFPKNWEVLDGSSVSLGVDTLARTMGDWAAGLYAPSRQARVVDGGEVLTLEVPSGAAGAVRAEADFTAWAVSAVVFGLEVSSGVKSAFGLEGGDGGSRFLSVVTGGGPATDYVDALKSCTKAMTGLVAEQDNAAAVVDEILKTMFGCVPSLASADLKATGWTMFGGGIVLQGLVGAISAVLTAVNLVVTGVREIWDNVAGLGGNSDPVYDIRVRRPAPQLTLSTPWGPYQSGFGETRPSVIFYGGNPQGLVTGIRWQTWGGEVAQGTGFGTFVGPDDPSVADGDRSRVIVYAWDIGDCAGGRAYRMWSWYFPDEDDPAQSYLTRPPDVTIRFDPSHFDGCDANWRDFLDTFTPSAEFQP